MAALTRVALKATFETGDKPTGSNFVDLIDSCVNLQDTATQIFVSNIQAPGVTVSTVSAASIFATNIFVAGSASVSAFDPATVSAQVVNASAVNATIITAPTVSAQVVRASAVRHKNPHALVYGHASNVHAVLAAASAYTIVSALLSGSPDGLVGFTQNGSTTVTYTGANTAAMHVGYALGLSYNTANSVAAASLFKNSVAIPESRCSSTIDVNDGSNASSFSGSSIVKMKTSDTVDVRIKVSTANTYNLRVESYNLFIVPVSWEF